MGCLCWSLYTVWSLFFNRCGCKHFPIAVFPGQLMTAQICMTRKSCIVGLGSLAPRHVVPCVLCEDFPGCIALSGNTKDKSSPQMSVCLPTLPAGGPSCRARLRHWFGTPGSGCKRNPKGIYIDIVVNCTTKPGLGSAMAVWIPVCDPCMDPMWIPVWILYDSLYGSYMENTKRGIGFCRVTSLLYIYILL